MINILFVYAGQFHKGGTEQVMLNIFKYIDKSKFKIDFLLLSKDELNDTSRYLKKQGARIFCVCARRENWKKHRIELRKFFERYADDYDIVHTHIDAIAAEALREARRSGIKIRIAHSHNSAQLQSPKNLKDILHRILIEIERLETRCYATAYIGCSKAAAKWLFGNQFLSKPHFILRNGIDTNKFRFSESLRSKVRKELGIDGKKVIGHVGAFNFAKNHEFLIKVFNELHRIDIDTVLILVGEGENKSHIVDLMNSLGLSGSVLFLGNRDDVNELLMAMDVFVFPSKHEGLPLALVEAQATGLPCVVSNNVSLEADMQINKMCFLDISKQEVEWAAKIMDYLDNDDRNNIINCIKRKGYDIKKDIIELEVFYKFLNGLE